MIKLSKFIVGIYSFGLVTWILIWLLQNSSAITFLAAQIEHQQLALVLFLYFLSHIGRLIRLALIALDGRNLAKQATLVHLVTLLPGSLLPFKVGEIFRLLSFVYVFKDKNKAVAIWLVERFGDLVVIAVLLLTFVIFKFQMPASLEAIFVLFSLFVALGAFALFSLSKVLVYLNRHLILNSLSARSLNVLKLSHRMMLFESTIKRSIEGRWSGILLTSVLIWIFEVLAIAAFVTNLQIGNERFMEHLSSALLGGQLFNNGDEYDLVKALMLSGLSLAGVLLLTVYSRSKNRVW